MRRVPWCLSLALAGVLILSLGSTSGAAEKTPAERGAEAARGKPAMTPPVWSLKAYEAVWKQWGLKEKPADFARVFRQRYGLHSAGYDNHDLPMGLHEASGPLGFKGISTDCLLCHAGTVAGKTVIGLGNTALDLQALFDEMSAADGARFDLPFQVSYVRGTIDPIRPVTFFMEFRDADLNVQKPIELDHTRDVCSDPPAWWQLKKKKTRQWNGAIDARATRVDIATILHPLNTGEYVRKQEPVFADIHAFVLGTESPRYPFEIDAKRAARGKEIFTNHCSECHGTYGEKWTYPNKVVALKKIGTDPVLAESLTEKNVEYINRTWLTGEKGPDGEKFTVVGNRGYQAPPLDGVWATAPYLHNSSVPTVYHVLNSKARPKFFTRSFGTGKDDYDPAKLGVKYTELKARADPKSAGIERRKVYDTTRPGQDNGGHTFGDDLTEEERMNVIEYLKTL